MNYIQRAWLVALRPLTTFVNEKLAKKSGMIGKLGRFFAFGPRQFGYHPSHRLLAYVNYIIAFNIGTLFHRYSLVKSITMRGHTFFRGGRAFMHMGIVCFVGSAIALASPEDLSEDGTSLKYIKERTKVSPINALQNRISAHFTEINSMYLHQMGKKYLEKKAKLIENRNLQTDEVKKTKYARSGYKYIAAHSNFKQQSQQ